jgi:hypothetical protein
MAKKNKMPVSTTIKSQRDFQEVRREHDIVCPPVLAGDVKKGDIVLLKGRPCKITNISVAK